jgi:hypothetical protein
VCVLRYAMQHKKIRGFESASATHRSWTVTVAYGRLPRQSLLSACPPTIPYGSFGSNSYRWRNPPQSMNDYSHGRSNTRSYCDEGNNRFDFPSIASCRHRTMPSRVFNGDACRIFFIQVILFQRQRLSNVNASKTYDQHGRSNSQN